MMTKAPGNLRIAHFLTLTRKAAAKPAPASAKPAPPVKRAAAETASPFRFAHLNGPMPGAQAAAAPSRFEHLRNSRMDAATQRAVAEEQAARQAAERDADARAAAALVMNAHNLATRRR